jgi:septum site-determining protein MinC
LSELAAPRQSIRFRGRTYMAFVLSPELPIATWLEDLDHWIARSAGFFLGKMVVLDLTGLRLTRPEYEHLLRELHNRDIRPLGIEGGDPDWRDPNLPMLLNGGRSSAAADLLDAPPANRSAAPAAAPQPAPNISLVIDEPVRSGQSIIHPHGDVTVIGAISSGAEVVAGGSIHVYGTIRGRAMAGSTGNTRARIFCRRNEAELIAIDGLYRTADDMESDIRGRAIQAWLDGNAMIIRTID